MDRRTEPVLPTNREWFVLSDELFHVVLAQTDVVKMFAAHVDLGEDVLVADVLPVGVDIIHDPIDLEVGDHFLAIVRHDKCMGFARRLKDIGAFGSFPIMF